jgi:hypothetical protein
MAVKDQTRVPQAGTSPVDFNRGNILLREVADRYPSLPKKVIENVSNALDAKATAIFVYVDLLRRVYTVRDNGSGATRERIDEALLDVGQSLKTSRDIGKYGMGLWAPATLGSIYTFTTKSRATNGDYLTWIFKKQEIRQLSRANSRLRWERQSDLRLVDRVPSFGNSEDYLPLKAGTYKDGVWWTTEVFVKGLEKDSERVSFDAPDFEYEIKSRFGRKMLKNKTTIFLKVVSEVSDSEKLIVGSDITGLRLSTETYDTPTAGRVYIDLSIPDKAARVAGRIDIMFGAGEPGECDHVFWPDFIHSGGAKHLSAEVLEVLRGGELAGFVNSPGLCMASERNRLINDQALKEVCQCLTKYVRERAMPKLKDVHDVKKNDLRRESGELALEGLKDFFQMPSVAPILERLRRQATVGSQGKGHADTGAKSLGMDTGKAVRPTGKGEGRPPSAKTAPIKAKQNHIPNVVWGEGGERQLVKGDSTGGLSFRYENHEGSSRLWSLDPATCTISININHAQWGVCEGRGLKVLVELQQRVVVGALALLSQGKDKFAVASPMVDEFVRLGVAQLVSATTPKKK